MGRHEPADLRAVPSRCDQQFEGYDELEELDWERYRAGYPDIGRLDRILRAEGEDPDRFKLAKQADTVMLFFLFDYEELEPVFARLGYPFDRDLVHRTVEYYDERTSHGSTLSHVTFAAVLADLDPPGSWSRFMLALESDVSDLQGGTTKEGIHMGVMAGTLDVLQRTYVGTRVDDGVLVFRPRLVDRLDGVSFSIRFRGTPLRVRISGGELTVLAQAEGFHVPIRVALDGREHELGPGDSCVFTLPAQRSSTARQSRGTTL